MFVQSCFIKNNTSRLRNKLERMGYINGGGDRESVGRGALYCYDDKYYEIYSSKPSRYHSVIDCGKNEMLFVAIAALTNKRDKYQWFTNCNAFIWMYCQNEKMKDNVGLHKANVNELIEHFNK